MLYGGAEKAAHEHAIAGAPRLFFSFHAVFFEDLFDIGTDVVLNPFVEIADDIVHVFIRVAFFVFAGLRQKPGFLIQLRVVEFFVRPASGFLSKKYGQQVAFARIAGGAFAFIAIRIPKSARAFAGAHPFGARAQSFARIVARFFGFDATDVGLRENAVGAFGNECGIFGPREMRPNRGRSVWVFRDEVAFVAVDAISPDMRHFRRAGRWRNRSIAFGVVFERSIAECIAF